MSSQNLTAKERLVDIIRREGFDFITACGHADEIIRRATVAVTPISYDIGAVRITIGRS